jgi:hypothetical protein
MSVGKGSFFERVIRAIKRGVVANDAGQCRRERQTDRQSPIRWVSLR